MSCERFREAITDYACGSSIGADAAAHLAACPACDRAYHAHRRALDELDGTLGAALAVAPSADFVGRVQAHVHARSARPSWMLAPGWAWGLAAAAVILAGVFITWERPQSAEALRAKTDAGSHPPSRVGSPARDGAAGSIHQPISFPRRSTSSDVRKRVVSGSTGPVPPVADPEVLVPPDQLRAIARLDDLMRARVLDEATLPRQRPDGEPLADVAVRPVTVTDIPLPEIDTWSRPVAGGEPERQ